MIKWTVSSFRLVSSTILIILAMILAWPVVLDFMSARASSGWPTTTGTIIELRDGKPGNTRILIIRYRYRVGKLSFESEKISYNKHQGRNRADMIKQYPRGSKVKVYYNPDHLSQAVLESGFILNEFYTSPFVLETLLMIFLLLLIIEFFPGLRQWIRDRIARGEAQPVPAELFPKPLEPALKPFPDKPGSQMTPEEIYIVITTGTEDQIIQMFNTGADVNSRELPGTETALMAAINSNAGSLVGYLVMKGADVNAVSIKGATPLMTAAIRGYTDIVKLLLVHGADVHYRDPENNLDALFYAAARGHLEIAVMLMEKGADIRVRVRNGSSAVIDALQCYYENPDEWNYSMELVEVVRFLISHGIDPEIRDNEGNSAHDYAVKFDADGEVMDLLEGEGEE